MPARKEKSRSNFISCREAFALISKLVSMPLGQGLQSDQQFTATFRKMTPNKRITLFYRFISLLQSSNDEIYIYIYLCNKIYLSSSIFKTNSQSALHISTRNSIQLHCNVKSALYHKVHFTL